MAAGSSDVISIELTTHPLKDKLDQYFALAYHQVQQIDNVLQRFLLLGKPSEMAFVSISVFAFLQKFIPCIQRKALEQNIALTCEFPSSDGQPFLSKDKHIFFKLFFQEFLRKLLCLLNVYLSVDGLRPLVVFLTILLILLL